MAKKIIVIKLAVMLAALIMCACALNSMHSRADAIDTFSVMLDAQGVYATGILAGPNDIITCAHIFDGTQEYADISVRAHIGNNTYPLRLIAIDAHKDIALLKGEFTVSAYAVKETQNTNNYNYAYISGNAYGAEIITSKVISEYKQVSISSESKSYLGLTFRGEVPPGFSGAPILSKEGILLGMVVSRHKSQQIIYALSAAEIWSFAEKYIC